MARRERGDQLDFGLYGTTELGSILTSLAHSAETQSVEQASITMSTQQQVDEGESKYMLPTLTVSTSPTRPFLNHFGHVYQRLNTVDRFALRQSRPHGAEPFYAFTVEFKNEHVVREFLRLII